MVTAATFALLALALLAAGPLPFLGLIVAAVLVAQGEFYLAARRGGYEPATSLGLVAGAVLLVGAYLRGEAAGGLVLFLTLLFSYVWYMGLDLGEAAPDGGGRGRRRRPAADSEGMQRPPGRVSADIAVTTLGVAYVPLLASFAVLLLARPDGRGLIVTLVGSAALYDTLAYFGGRRFGKRPLARSISPNKTLEGAVGATAGTLVFVSLLAPRLGPWSIPQAALLAALVCILAPLGDLFESMAKRDLGIKDTGRILPGHGGVLDRIDAILFCAPGVYLSLRVFGL